LRFFQIIFQDFIIYIGTGCGLLSLYAAEAGADQVTALEVFPPVAKIAKKVFDKSQYADKIRLITSRSTDLLSMHLF
jgi:type II protein arginine methyltransferase